MAAPRHRRRGFSRRVQFSLFIGYVIAVVGAVFGLALILIARFDPQGFSILRGAAIDVTAPIVVAGDAGARGARAVGSGIGAYVRAGSQNQDLRAELAAARIKLVNARAAEFENRRLKALLGLIGNDHPPVAVARLVGSDVAGHRRFATLTAGANMGVRPGQPVRAAEGLVGRVFETGQFASRILLLTDGGSAVPVRIARDGVPALATGRGDGAMDLRALIGGRPFRRGDIAVTSGTGGVYPPNIPVAVVTQADGETAIAWPLADPARLDAVMVERIYQPRLPPPPGLPGSGKP